MRRATRTLLLPGLLAIAVAACSGQPGSSVSPATGAPASPAGGPPMGDDVVITAVNLEFEPRGVTVRAGRPFTIELDNRDRSIPHDLQVSDSGGTVIVQSEIVTGPGSLTIEVPALAAGTYTFTCVVHPNMTGTITAE